MKLQSPIPGASFSSDKFGPREPITTPGGTTGNFHYGQDIDAAANTPIRAAGDGKVTIARWVGTYGYAVYIDHGDNLVTRYAHMIAQPPVSAGWYVEAGQVIGFVGSTGASTGPHLHWEVVKDGTRVDPLTYIKEDDMYNDEDRKRDNTTAKQIGEIHWMLDQRIRPQLDKLEGITNGEGWGVRHLLGQRRDEIAAIAEKLDKLTRGEIEDDHTTHPHTQ